MKRLFALTLSIFLILSVLAGCASQPPAAEPEAPADTAPAAESPAEAAPEEAPAGGITRGGSVTVAKSEKPTTLYPPKSNSSSMDAYFYGQVFDTLVAFDADFNLAPGLATEWSIGDDGLSITMKLREGVKFHDGTDFNAEAVKYNLEWFITEECGHLFAASELNNITSVDVVDAYTAKINLAAPDAALLTAFTNISGMMLSPTHMKNNNNDPQVLGNSAVGTGPFKVKEHIEGSHLTLERFEDYWDIGEDGETLPYLDGITFRIMTDDSVKTTNLQSGDVDAVDQHSSANSVIKAQSMDHVKTVMTDHCDTFFLCFNLNDPKYDDVRIRQAVSYAVNREELIGVVLEGIGMVQPFDSLPSQWFFNDYNPYSYNPEKAKELLTEAGYPDGIDLKLNFISREPDNTMCQLLQEQLKASNINLEIEGLERLAWIELIRTNRSGEMGIGVISIMGLDPNQQYRSTLQYCEPTKIVDIQNLLLSAKETYVQAERKAILDEYQKMYLDNAYYVMLGQRPRYVSYSNDMQGVFIKPNGVIDYRAVWLDR